MTKDRTVLITRLQSGNCRIEVTERTYEGDRGCTGARRICTHYRRNPWPLAQGLQRQHDLGQGCEIVLCDSEEVLAEMRAAREGESE